MTWKFDKAIERGNVTEIQLVNEVDGEQVNALSKTFTFSPKNDADPKLTKVGFVIGVKQEVDALLAQLNRVETVTDVTAEFAPDK